MNETSSGQSKAENSLDADVAALVRDWNRGTDIKRSRQEEAIRGVFNQAVRDIKPLIELLTEARKAGVEVGLHVEPPRPPDYSECCATLICPELDYHAGPRIRTGLRYGLRIHSGKIEIEDDPTFGGLDNGSDRTIAEFVAFVKQGVVANLALTKLQEVEPPELPEPFTF